MTITVSQLENKTEIKTLTATVSFGMGLITAIVYSFCMLFGLECAMLSHKIDKAKNAASQLILDKAKSIGADGVMNVRFVISGLTVLMYGTAYKNK